MQDIALQLARLAGGLFTGACVYIVLVEQPARMASKSSVAIAQFRRSLPRAERMQPALLVFAALAAAIAYVLQPTAALLAGGLVLSSIVPLSLALLVPINRRLLSGSLEDQVEHGMRLIERWGRLHALRTALAVTGMGLLYA